MYGISRMISALFLTPIYRQGITLFCIKAANNDGKWNEEPAILHIHILPVWYSTWWALSLFALSFALLVFGIVRFFWLRKSMQAEITNGTVDKEKREEISQMKIRFYVNISHELRTPLTLIVAPLQELLDRISGHWSMNGCFMCSGIPTVSCIWLIS